MRLGVIASSNGETFAQMCRGAEHLGVSFTVITDRPCGIEAVARERDIPCRRIDGDRHEFSRQAARALRAQSADAVLLYFNRLVGPELYEHFPTYNVHPSLLPAFPGFGALEGAREREARYVGATLHLATEQADSGPIVAQVCAAVWPPCSATEIAELSFVQRVYLSLLCVELVLDDALDVDPAGGSARHVARRPFTDRCNPAIQDPGMLALIDELEAARARKAAR
ncbi:MAG: formyltransferase family protein [Solirubrobacteraceae bacterium]|nr:formyltransferase family protein [Solirubrobacteraceae bacterium]